MNQRHITSTDQSINSLLAELVGGGQDEKSIDFLAYWQVVLKYKWGILALTLVTAILAYLYTTTLTPRYNATTTLLYDPPSSNNYGTVRDIVADNYNSYYRNFQLFKSQEAIMKSRKFVGDLVDKYELWNHHYFHQDLSGHSRYLSGFVKDWAPQWLKDFVEVPPAPQRQQLSSEQLKDKYRAAAIGAVMAGMRLSSQEDIMLISLGFTSEDPEFAADMANKLADFYIEYDLKQRLDTFKQATSWLTERTFELRDNVQNAEKELQAFRDDKNLVDLGEGGSIMARQIEDVYQRLSEARKRVQSLALIKARIKAPEAGTDLIASTPELIKYPGVKSTLETYTAATKDIDQLALVYGPKHPKMIAAATKAKATREKLDREISLVITGLDSDYRVARAEEQKLADQFDRLSSEMKETDKVKFKLSSMERGLQTDQELYNLFVTRFKELNLGSDISSPHAQIIDYAQVPGGAFWPNKPRIIMIFSAVAFFFALGLAFLREYLDKTIKTPDELEEKMGVPLLGFLAQLSSEKEKNFVPERMFIEHNKSLFAESIRTIRTGVMLSGLDNPYKVLAISSTVPSEGKTTVSMNLACALGQLEKVLLIDADMRRAALGPHFGFARNTKGLSDVVAGLNTLEECIHRYEEGGIDILPAGTIPPNPQELLSSHKFEELITKVANEYDRVVIDTAPTLLVSDPKLVVRYASAIIYVIRAESTYYQIAAKEIRALARVDKPLLGVVLNGVKSDPGRSRNYRRYGRYGGRYGYGGYGYGGYGDVYGESPDDNLPDNKDVNSPR